jgi:uncharacterized damage-inducible protein DinB
MTGIADPLSLLLADLDAEVAASRRILGAFPDGQGDFRPHAKSRSIGELANHIATIPQHGVRILTMDQFDVTTRKPVPPRDTASGLVEEYNANIEAFRAAMKGVDEAKLREAWTMSAGPKVLVSAPRTVMLRLLFLNHIIHHRAQLGVYLRLLDIPVPGTYGPSADE